MITLAPAILTADANLLQQQLSLYATFAKRIQLDIADGTLAADTTVQLSALAQLPAEVSLDLHLIALRPSDHLTQILRLKPSLCILHAEAGENLLPLFEQLKAAGIKTGVALLPSSFPGKFKPYLEVVDHALIFAGTLGRQGGTANLLQTEKVKLIRAIKPEIEIGWDGGANLQNIRALAHSKIDIINVGSAISRHPEPATAYVALLEESEKRGVAI